MNIGSMRPIASNDSRHVPLCQFDLDCGIDESSNPGIICTIGHQDLLNPSEHGTSSMGKHLLVNAHIAKLDELTEFQVIESTRLGVDETAVAILKRKRSWEITMVSLQRKIIFEIQFNAY
jgi:hypothetical protein